MKKLILIISPFLVFFLLVQPAYPSNDSRDSDSPYGVLGFLIWNHDWNYYHYDTTEKIARAADLMKEAGIEFVRMDFLWVDVEPKPGVFDFAKYDTIVNILHERGIKILGILHYNPSWDNEPWNKAPNPKLYTRYATKTVKHFKDRVKYWEIWNEPDEPEYWMPQDGMKAYSSLLKMVYPAIKRVDPTSEVLMGGVSNRVELSIKTLYARGCKNYFDIINIHPFANPIAKDPIKSVYGLYKSVRKVMIKNNDGDKKIWFTEIGCPGVKKPSRRIAWWHGIGPNEQEQAKWVKRIYEESLKWKNVDKVFWAFFRDTDSFFKSAVDYFGLVDCNFRKKPSYRIYKDIATSSK